MLCSRGVSTAFVTSKIALLSVLFDDLTANESHVMMATIMPLLLPSLDFRQHLHHAHYGEAIVMQCD